MENLPPESTEQSTCSLLQPQPVKGSDFVQLLNLIGYPNAKNLKGENFDWLCEIGEVQFFLGWLCEVVDKRNTVTNEQLAAYQALLDSGQPILDTEELQSICNSGEKIEVVLEIDDMRTLEELETECQRLRTLKTHRLRFRNKMESLGLTLRHKKLILERSERALVIPLNRMKEEIVTVDSNFALALEEIGKTVLRLGQHYLNQPPDNVFVSSLNLEGFMNLEQTCWKQIEQSARRLFPFKEEVLEDQKKAQQEMEEENERLRTSWATHKIKMSISLGFLNGTAEALAWLGRLSKDQVWDPQRLPLLEREVRSLEEEVETLQLETLPALVYDESVGLCSYAHLAWACSEKRRLLQVSKCQAVAAQAILTKMSRLQMVELGLQFEKGYHHQIYTDLQNVKTVLAGHSLRLSKRLLLQKDLRASPQWQAPLHVDSRDQTGVRLLAMLEKFSTSEEPFPKYEALKLQALFLVDELRPLRFVFHECLPEIVILEKDTEDLHQSMCRGTRNLQLQDMRLALTSESLSAQVHQFSQWFSNFFQELECKRMILHTAYMSQGQMLYVYFFKDPALLAHIVKDLEQKVQEFT